MRAMHPSRLYIGNAAERAALSLPAEKVGATLYDTDGASLYYWNGASWEPIGSGGDVTAADIDSETAADGTFLMADGSGGASWEPVTGLAENITFTPAGSIDAADVQAALEEVDSEKVTGPATSTDNAVVRFDGATGKLVQASGVTVSDEGDIANGGQGLFTRLVNFGFSPTNHFRTGDAPGTGDLSAYSWQTDGSFVAPPETPSYNYLSDWLRAGKSSSPMFLSKTISAPAVTSFSDMLLTPGQNASIGWRVDDGSGGTGWAQFIATSNLGGEYTLNIADSAGISVSYGPFYWSGPFLLRFSTVVSSGTYQHRLYALTATGAQGSQILTTTYYRSWVPSRSGLYFAYTAGNYGFVDWFKDYRG